MREAGIYSSGSCPVRIPEGAGEEDDNRVNLQSARYHKCSAVQLSERRENAVVAAGNQSEGGSVIRQRSQYSGKSSFQIVILQGKNQ